MHLLFAKSDLSYMLDSELALLYIDRLVFIDASSLSICYIWEDCDKNAAKKEHKIWERKHIRMSKSIFPKILGPSLLLVELLTKL